LKKKRKKRRGRKASLYCFLMSMMKFYLREYCEEPIEVVHGVGDELFEKLLSTMYEEEKLL